MRPNAELRKEARQAIRGGWLWRILCVLLILQLIEQTAGRLLAYLNESLGIVSCSDFLERKFDALRQGIDFALPTQEAYRQMWIATGFEYFVGTLLGAIALFGMTAVALKAIRNDEREWFTTGFAGLRRPLGVFALLLVQNLIVDFWTLFLIVPGIIASYRYRQAWYLKCEHPDWGVRQCLGESAKMMKGYKGLAFGFDLGYFGRLFLVGLCAACGYALCTAENGLLNAAGLFVLFASLVVAAYVLSCFVVGRAVFYRELKSELKPEVQDDLPRND